LVGGLVAGGWWLVAGGWWLVAGGWWLVAGEYCGGSVRFNERFSEIFRYQISSCLRNISEG
jgi:hypothetical protein